MGLLAAAIGVGGCDSSPTGPSNFAPYSQTDLRVGTGGDAVSGRVLTVHYTGWFYNASRPESKGPVFDSSAEGDPFIFTLGVGEVITGWDQGVAGMRVGGRRKLTIPSAMAYGARGAGGVIEPHEPLVFVVDLLGVD